MKKETDVFGKAEIQGKAVKNAARAVLAAGMTLSACTPALKPIETPSSGEAMPVGLLDTNTINNLPAGEVKDSFLTELNDVKEDCAEIAGCMGDSVQIYRVITNEKVFSYRFANVEDDNGLRTQILSVMDGKTKEKTEINEDLVAVDTVIDGDPIKVFGYVDDLGNSHFLLLNRETDEGNKFQVFDPQGNIYDVITQNEKEVQAYSHLWQEPSIVQAEALPTNTPTPTETPAPTISKDYPSSSENFILDAQKVYEAQAISMINNNGSGEDAATLIKSYEAELLRTGKDKTNFSIEPVVWREEGGFLHWDYVAKNENGQYLGIKLTNNEGEQVVVKEFGLAKYVSEFSSGEDYFDFFTLNSPTGWEEAEQRLIWDKSGWQVIGLFYNNNFAGWFNADKNQWEMVVESIDQVKTPEAEDVWQPSPDGHIYYNEAELYGGMFTINKEHPEYVEKYWEDAVRGLWNINRIGQNSDFMSQFYTEDYFMDYVRQGKLVSNLWIPVIYPEGGRENVGEAALVPTSRPVDLSTIALSIYKPTLDEIYSYSGEYPSTNYLSFIGGKGEVLIKEMSLNGNNILSFGFRKDTLMDETITFKPTGIERTFLAFSDEKTPEENLQVALQLIRSWNATALNLSYEYKILPGTRALLTEYDPPQLQIFLFTPKDETWAILDNLEESPLSVR